jgi:hypothetical protein
MFFEKYHNLEDYKIRESLVWEYLRDKIKWQQMRNSIFSVIE